MIYCLGCFINGALIGYLSGEFNFKFFTCIILCVFANCLIATGSQK